MPRPPRVLYENAYYHVMNRGIGKGRIFFNDCHKRIFLSLLEDVTLLFNAKIIAYCLLHNHYHLLICTPDANLPKIMQRINGLYTKRLNYLLETDGPIFRGRYKALIIEHDAYLLYVSCYIHLNPIKSKLVEKPEKYYWSSYQFFINRYSF